MNSIENRLLTIPLESEAHQLARQFAVEQANPQKGKCVYLNTLSVYAVHKYFKWLQIETDLSQSDCWNPQLRSLLNVADLVIPNVGTVECRPVLPGETVMCLPLEVTENRIGYVAVQFGDRLDSVQLLGFAPAFTTEPPEQLQLSDLQPIENILDHLVPQTAPATPGSSQVLVDLNQWLRGVFEVGWRSLEDLFGSELGDLAYAVRSSASASVESFTAGKLINLGMQLENQSVLLLVGTALEEDGRIRVRVRLCSDSGETYLPANLSLALLSRSGEVINQVQEQTEMDYIQLRAFKLQAGTRFSIQVTLGDISIIEDFTV